MPVAIEEVMATTFEPPAPEPVAVSSEPSRLDAEAVFALLRRDAERRERLIAD
jgi:hypothetical protein